jgi:hypothetical protein
VHTSEQAIEPAPAPPPQAGGERRPVQNHEPLFVSSALLEQAEQVCRRRLAKDPENLTVLSSLAQIYRKQGNLSDALPIYQRLTELNPQDLEAQYTHAILAGTNVPTGLAGVRPAPFVFMKNFLPASFHESLLPFVLTVQEKLVPAMVGGVGHYNPDTRESLDLPGIWPVKNCFREKVREFVPEVARRLHVAPFEIGDFEVKLRAYLDGHFFKTHMDSHADVESCKYRQVSYVYFFHKMPRAYTGGDLMLFDTNIEANTFTTSSFTRIVPQDNSIIFFPSAYWHSVIPVSCPSKEYADSRFVINGHVSKVAPQPAGEVTAGTSSGPAASAEAT